MNPKYICPNCGAESTTGGRCEYCGGILQEIDNKTADNLTSVSEINKGSTNYVFVNYDEEKGETVYEAIGSFYCKIDKSKVTADLDFQRVIPNKGEPYLLIKITTDESEKAGPRDCLEEATVTLYVNEESFNGTVVDWHSDFGDYVYDYQGRIKVSKDGQWRLVREHQWATFKFDDCALDNLGNGHVSMEIWYGLKTQRINKISILYLQKFYNGAYDRHAFLQQIAKAEQDAERSREAQKAANEKQAERKKQRKAKLRQHYLEERAKARKNNGCFTMLLSLFAITTIFFLFVCVPIFGQKVDRYGLKVVKCVRVTEYPNYDDNPVWESVYTMEYDDSLGLKQMKVERDRNDGSLRLYHMYTRKGNIVERYSPDETPYGTLVEYHFNKDGVIGEKVQSSERLGEDGMPIKGMVRSKRMETFEYTYVNHVSFPLLMGKELSFYAKTVTTNGMTKIRANINTQYFRILTEEWYSKH